MRPRATAHQVVHNTEGVLLVLTVAKNGSLVVYLNVFSVYNITDTNIQHTNPFSIEL